MSTPRLLKATLLGAAGLAGAAWLGLSLYTQPREHAVRQAAVRQFLERALAGDSAGLAARAAAAQPVRWALAAARRDSAALREWTGHGGPVDLLRRGDTLWVTLRRHRTTPRCSHYGALVATLLAPSAARPGDARLLEIRAACPDVPVAATGG